MRGRIPKGLALGVLLAAGLGAAEASAAAFLAVELRKPDEKSMRVFKVDTATKKALVSREVPSGTSKLSGDRTRFYVTNSDVPTTVFCIRTSDLTIQERFEIPDELSGVGLEFLFVHPTTGLVYLTSTFGSMPNKVIVADPLKKTIVEKLRAPAGHTVKGGFTYDRKRDWVYVNSSAPFAIDGMTQRIVHVIDLDGLLTKPPVDLRRGYFRILRAALYPLPGGKLLIDPDLRVEPQLPPVPPMLLLYDPDRESVVRRSGPLPPLGGRALSQDGTRFVAATGPDASTGVVIDTSTLGILHSVTFPEPARVFVPAPDGQGLWMVARSGKVYRLDDQTGQVLEPIPLPFPVYTIITSAK
ncbi:MAG TPA: hypothetical protein VJM10_04520 [Candidatus Methylomirabilis sp.]|nr:hypothetical protein [Candidatus Methylomirabilis sp.]